LNGVRDLCEQRPSGLGRKAAALLGVGYGEIEAAELDTGQRARNDGLRQEAEPPLRA
jgi:hypothetical protein